MNAFVDDIEGKWVALLVEGDDVLMFHHVSVFAKTGVFLKRM